MRALPAVQRIVLHIAVATVVLLAITLAAPERLIMFDRVQPLAITALVLGALLAEIDPTMRRFGLSQGCTGYAVAAFAVSAAALWALASALPGMQATLAGVIAGAVLMMLTGGAVYTLLDEQNPPKKTRRG